MSILRQANILGQQRLDVPHLRALESSIAADFDLLAGSILAGSKALVIKGFDLVTANAVGNPATGLQLSVANSIVMHPLASESGTIFNVAPDAAPETLNGTNPNLTGAFTPGQVNYVGLDLRRQADSDTADLVMFLDANTLIETPKTVPLARTLQYKIIISTTDFSSTENVLPLAKVTTDSVNTVTAIEDARQLLFRLGSGGSVPDKQNTFLWLQERNEKTNDSLGSVFQGGDKSITSFKAFSDALMTRIWELGGGEFWYSGTSDRDVKLAYGPTVLASNQDNFNWTLATQTLEWSDISLVFANSTATYNVVYNGTAVLGLDTCLYVDVNRALNGDRLTAQTAPLANLGLPTVPGSRFIIAWRRGDNVFVRGKEFEVGRAYKVATDAAGSSGLGVVRLSYAAGTTATPTVAPLDVNGAIAITATANNANAITGVGNGTGYGVHGTGGNSNGWGGLFQGKGTGGGLYATTDSATALATATTAAVYGHNYSTGYGTQGYSANSFGVRGDGVAGGVIGVGTSQTAYGGWFQGGGTYAGVYAESSTGVGVSAKGGTNNHGVLTAGTGTGHGVHATAGIGSGASGIYARGSQSSSGSASTYAIRAQGAWYGGHAIFAEGRGPGLAGVVAYGQDNTTTGNAGIGILAYGGDGGNTLNYYGNIAIDALGGGRHPGIKATGGSHTGYSGPTAANPEFMAGIWATGGVGSTGYGGAGGYFRGTARAPGVHARGQNSLDRAPNSRSGIEGVGSGNGGDDLVGPGGTFYGGNAATVQSASGIVVYGGSGATIGGATGGVGAYIRGGSLPSTNTTAYGIDVAGGAASPAIKCGGDIEMAGTNPTPATAVSNQLTKMNLPKAWVYATWTGADAPVVASGFNVTSVTKSGTNKLVFTFAGDMADSNYCILGMTYSPGNAGYIVMENIADRAMGSFSISIWSTTGSLFDFTTTGGSINLLVFGAQ